MAHDHGGYELLPPAPTASAGVNTNSWPIPKWMSRPTHWDTWLRPRLIWTAVACLATFTIFVSFFHWPWGKSDVLAHAETQWASNATNFDDIFLKEAQLPQHNLSLPYPEGQNGRYLRFSNQVWGVGFNNLLQERLLNTILAYEANRGPVFSPFEAWAHPPRPDTTPDGGRHVLVTPYNALLSGPTSGAPWGPNDEHPRAISQKWFDDMCPRERRKVINADDVMKQIGKDSDGIRMLEQWTEMLKAIPDTCVELLGTQVFDVVLIGSTRLLSLWDIFRNHPTIRRLQDSDIVKAAVLQNMGKLQEVNPSRPYAPKTEGVVAGLMAIHIRRGDFYESNGVENGHCIHLSQWACPFAGWNQLPELLDQWNPPPRPEGQTPPEVTEYYLRRCLPTTAQAVSRLHELRAEWPSQISKLFIATNAEESYLTELRTALAADGWAADAIVTSKELHLNWQAESVSQAVDMSIMSRAELFVGNGFSSMTSNVVMRRLTTGMSVQSVRHW